VKSARLLADGTPVSFKTADFGVVLTLPATLDPVDTIIVLELAGQA
jgi:hypothetical protein